MRAEKRWAELMARHTKKSKVYWEDIHKPGKEGAKPELWLSAGQMKQYGVIDEVLKDEAFPGTM
jgi:ATP-dependent protease ClpP protease subunit